MNISLCKFFINQQINLIQNLRHLSSAINNQLAEPQFGLLFDIDGVLTRGRKLLPYTRDAFRNLVKANGEFRIPTLFVTNAGNELRLSKAAKLTQILGISILPEQVILSHSPLKLFSEFHTKHCLISGQGPIAEIAKNLGFTKVTTIEQLSDAFPNLDMVDHKKRRGFHSPFRDYFLPIEAVVLFGEPVKWEACLQLIIDVLMTNGNPSSPIVRAPVSHLPILASNADLLWMAEAALPRFGHGSFLHCLENLYEKISGHQLQYTTIVGKPSEVTFYHAEYLISRHAHELGLKQPIKRLYVVGDNPDTDVYGANVYNRYLQRRSLSRVNQIVSQTTIGTLTSSGKNISGKNLWSSSNSAEPAADNIEQYYTAESLESILVCTGVFNRETYDETLGKNHGHRDMFIDAELRKPKHTCEHVLDAVKLIFDIEQFPQKHRGYPHDENPWSIENNMNLVRSSLITLQTHMKAERIVSALVLRHYSEWWLGVASDECRDHCTYADPVNSTRVNRDYGFCGPCPPDKLSSSAWQLIDLAAHISPERPFLINIGATSTVGGGQ
ncbi:unnamed protein product [Rotaria socialis]